MIHPELLRDKGVVIVSPSGKLEQTDFEELAYLVNPYIEKHGEINGMMILASDFPGWEDFAALVSHIRFVEDHQTRVKRVAVVSDDDILSLLPKLADHFVEAEVQHFPFAQREQAMSWLESSGT
ncbi:STAS/SEC14 domain-containing protein [Thiohalophilus sp.]|uniref:STAS/SEC14 domain-containing protein n=1 Tax=Thiohalophilus sp. TaxID=3028392 RepID=UPI0039760537